MQRLATPPMPFNHLPQTGGTVSDKPIVMRAEYAHTSNLTLVDTPGAIILDHCCCAMVPGTGL
jgi:hypothetical protein